MHIPLREDWTQTLLLVAGESLRRTEAVRTAREAESKAARNEHHATLGRYMIDMKHSVNNALTSMLGNAELLLLEPGQLSHAVSGANQRPFTAWRCVSTKSCSDSHPSPARCGS